MPWHIAHKAGDARPFKIVKSDTGEVVGSSETEEKAKASLRARYGSVAKKEALNDLAEGK